MKNPLRVANSPLTNNIYAGRVRGQLWSGEKHDVTIDALVAVAQHCINFGKPVIVTSGGKPDFEIIARRIEA